MLDFEPTVTAAALTPKDRRALRAACSAAANVLAFRAAQIAADGGDSGRQRRAAKLRLAARLLGSLRAAVVAS